VKHSVRLITWFPFASRIQAPKPTLLREAEKEASTLHLNLPTLGFDHLLMSNCEFAGELWILVSCAVFQLFRKATAQSPICWVVSTILFHTLLFLCFHKLQRVIAKICCWAMSSCGSKENIISAQEAVWDQICWIVGQKPSRCQQPTLLLHAKNRCFPSSSSLSHMAQVGGHWTPFVINRIRVGKQFRHMRHKKFLIFAGSLRFQIIFQFPETLWWSRTSLLLIISRYAMRTEYKPFFSNLHVALSTRTDCKRGVCRIWFDISALKSYRIKFSFHSFVFGLKRWPTVRASHMICTSVVGWRESEPFSHGWFHTEMVSPVPILHFKPRLR